MYTQGCFIRSFDPLNHVSRHCEEQSDEAIHSFFSTATWIASLRSQ
jgi:hypothetical protein